MMSSDEIARTVARLLGPQDFWLLREAVRSKDSAEVRRILDLIMPAKGELCCTLLTPQPGDFSGRSFDPADPEDYGFGSSLDAVVRAGGLVAARLAAEAAAAADADGDAAE